MRDAPADARCSSSACEPLAREIFPLGERDRRRALARPPPLPARHAADRRPRAAPRGLWFDFGHHHLGFTLGPVTGRLLAEMMTGETPFTDPAPYRAERF